jgi:[acyl-carrier-protein] S-malonyltransferase
LSKIAFLFPGQGAQSLGMGKQLIDSLPAARELFDRASAVLGYDLADVCLNGPSEKLNSTAYAQPALYVCSLAALEALKRDSPEIVEQCSLTAGLSLGEYTAMVFAGAMDFESGLRVVQQRGQAMQEAADLVDSGMASILGLDNEVIERLCNEASLDEEILQIANLLCPGNTAVSGHKAACERIAPMATEAGAMKVIPLAVAGAFHTPLMEPAVDKLRSALTSIQLQDTSIPVVSNVDAKPHQDAEEMREILVRQVVQPVRWEESMRWMQEQDVTQFYEIGPGKVLRGLLRRIDRQLPCENVIG